MSKQQLDELKIGKISAKRNLKNFCPQTKTEYEIKDDKISFKHNGNLNNNQLQGTSTKNKIARERNLLIFVKQKEEIETVIKKIFKRK